MGLIESADRNFTASAGHLIPASPGPLSRSIAAHPGKVSYGTTGWARWSDHWEGLNENEASAESQMMCAADYTFSVKPVQATVRRISSGRQRGVEVEEEEEEEEIMRASAREGKEKKTERGRGLTRDFMNAQLQRRSSEGLVPEERDQEGEGEEKEEEAVTRVPHDGDRDEILIAPPRRRVPARGYGK
ncbi:hypothetical protein KM043_013750 [Ampulex compressa]|nr:hypothetical protein KM043_013750 [Ampulex compressa]